MQLDIVKPVRLSLRILKLFGLWRLDNLYYRIYSYLLHFITTFSTTIFVLTSVVKAENFEQFAEPVFMTFTMVAYSIKVINILSLNNIAVNFLKQFEEKDFLLKMWPEELKIFKIALRTFYFVALIYTVACFTAVVFGSTVVAFGQKWVLQYPEWLPFEYRYESKYYWIAYCYQFLSMLMGCLANGSLDMLQCYFLRTTSLVYYVIGRRLSRLGHDLADVSDDSFEVNKIFLDELKEIINVHNFAKKLTADCERLLSLPNFIQIMSSAIVIGFTCYRLSFLSIFESPGRCIEMLDFLAVMGLQVYLPCYYGNQVTLEAGKLSEALYTSNWISLPLKSKKLIYLYMEFLKEPVHVKAGKFFHLSIPTFAKVINNAYSFFAVLIQMK